MARNDSKKKTFATVPGVIVECKSGRYLAFYEHRTDIIANGESEMEAKKNLKRMYAAVKRHEDGESEKGAMPLPKDYHTKKFTEKLQSI